MLYSQPIILDNGTGTIRCGLSSDDVPRIHYSNLIGRAKHNKFQCLPPGDIQPNDTLVGDEAQRRRGLLKLTMPMEHGEVVDWNALECVWQQVLTRDLPAATSGRRFTGSEGEDRAVDVDVDDEDGGAFVMREHAVLVSEQPFCSRRQREKMCELLFEGIGVGGVSFGIPAVLSLFATGRVTGVSVDIGDGVCCIASVYDGFAIKNGGVQKILVGGRDVTKWMQRECWKNGYALNSSGEFEIVRSMKERIGYVNVEKVDVQKYATGYEWDTFVLPDGKSVRMPKNSLGRPGEVLFQPQSFGYEAQSIQEAVHTAVMRCDVDLRAKLFDTIVLSGGATMARGFGSRLMSELRALDDEVKLKMFASAERRNNCFIGASVLSSLSTFEKVVVSRSEYSENNGCVHDAYF